MKAEYINPFLHSAKNVLETMCQTPVTPQKPLLKPDQATYGVITGIIAMSSEKVKGSLIVSFEEKCILKIIANMLMEEPKEEIDAEVVDAVGELTNMICGSAKAQLAKLEQVFEMSTPTILVGKGVDIKNFAGTPTITIPFVTANGNFVVEANLKDTG